MAYFVYIAGLIRRFYYSGNEWNWTNTIQLVFSKPCPQKRDPYKLKSMFSKHFNSGWILMVPNLRLLKYFDMTLRRYKSSKIEGSGPPLRPRGTCESARRSVCGEVPLEYGFAVLVWSEQHTVCFLMYNCIILSSAPGVFAGKHQWEITQSSVTLWS